MQWRIIEVSKNSMQFEQTCLPLYLRNGVEYPLEVHFVHGKILPLSHSSSHLIKITCFFTIISVNDDYKYNLTAALTEPDGLLVIGFLFEIANDWAVSITHLFFSRHS